MTHKVFVSRQLPGGAIALLREHFQVDVWSGDRAPSGDQLIESAQNCDGLLCMLTDTIDKSFLEVCPRLKVVSSMSVGVDHVDIDALNARHIPLGHTPGVLVDTTADLTFALLLAAARRIPEADNFVRAGNWQQDNRWAPDMFLGKDLAGATLGIIGLGEIGQAVARRAGAFNMRVISWTRSGRHVDGVESVSMDQLLSESDFVSVHVALTGQTRGLIDKQAIGKMKAGAVLVNTARGGIVDETALAEALNSRRLFAAGLDVFDQEPLQSESPLLELSNVVFAPHIGSASEGTRIKMATIAAENLLRGLRGEPMLYCVNKPA